MRKLCPNFDREDGLDTVLEVPVPEEMFTSMGSNGASRWANMRALMRAQSADKSSHLQAKSNDEFIALLKLVGSPLIPFQVHPDQPVTRSIRDRSIEASTAKYIVQQYVAATGGPAALNSVTSMYAVGQVKMAGSEMHQGDDSVQTRGNSEVSAGSDGKVAWNQSSSQPCHANRGPPRPLRRFFQGLDPRCTANLFLEAVCIGEKNVNNEDCFVLKLETDANVLKSQSSPNTEILHHTVWGYFSQRTGLLVKFEDTKLVKMKPIRGNDSVYWETSMESLVGDYRYIEGINIAHSGKTTATLYRYGESHNHKRKMKNHGELKKLILIFVGCQWIAFYLLLISRESKKVESND
ncbi:hypothetical protein GH714_015210 [Hevea brasiliensis]|uniref:Uncharacterized protein n=1 Tax=Hevea brasiliensis TaxID=3981 RepID=A0A6A6NHB9_HEVBR|nr:hypothetical protein GH714_015210 [Hevea brasiliensis]